MYLHARNRVRTFFGNSVILSSSCARPVPKFVARLVARLQRGEHGLFVTTSYYTKACQEEVFGDQYPVELISGGQLVGMAAQIGMRVE